MSDASRKIDLGTHALRVREAGAGAATFVCLHGFLEETSAWDGIVAGLGEVGRTVVVQQRAHGDSTAPAGPCSVDDLARDIVKLLDALGIERATLVGHELGGLVAMQVALAEPSRVSGLALVSSFAEIDARGATAWRQIVRAGEVNKLQGLARSVFGPTSRRQVDGDGIGLTEIARALQAFGNEPITARLGEIRCPTVVLAGERDAAGSAAARTIASAVTGARLELIPQHGAALHVESPELVTRAIRSLVS